MAGEDGRVSSGCVADRLGAVRRERAVHHGVYIHHVPPLRTWPDYPKGVMNLTVTQQRQVDEANILYEFVG